MVTDKKKIATHYLKTKFAIDLISIVPLEYFIPQVKADEVLSDLVTEVTLHSRK